MRNQYIVSYDISDPKRGRKVFNTLYGVGDHIQLSVFRCELTDRERIRLIAKLTPIVHHEEDQILFINLGPAPGRSDQAIVALGRPYDPVKRCAVVV